MQQAIMDTAFGNGEFEVSCVYMDPSADNFYRESYSTRIDNLLLLLCPLHHLELFSLPPSPELPSPVAGEARYPTLPSDSNLGVALVVRQESEFLPMPWCPALTSMLR